jgi:hypothetical protein
MLNKKNIHITNKNTLTHKNKLDTLCTFLITKKVHPVKAKIKNHGLYYYLNNNPFFYSTNTNSRFNKIRYINNIIIFIKFYWHRW